MGIGDRLRETRLAARLSQQQLADEANVSKQAVSKIEKGITASPSAATLDPICRRLGISTLWLLTGRGRKSLTGQASLREPLTQSQFLTPDPAILSLAYRWTLIGIGLHGGPPLKLALDPDARVVCSVYDMISRGGGTLPGDENSSELEAVIRQRIAGGKNGKVEKLGKRHTRKAVG